jgi:prepilin-type N-terminal cleavage/methylation domain-containing protein
MLQDTKKSFGFTLVELLVATAILGGIAAVSVQLLYNTVITRSSQYAIEDSVETIRGVTGLISSSIKSASSINIPNSTTIEIIGQPCRTIRLNTSTSQLEQALDNLASCTPPSTGFYSITSDQLEITSFDLSPVTNLPEVVNISIEGIHHGRLSDHPVSFKTSVVPRITL